MDQQGWRDFLFGADSIVGYDLILTPPRQRDAVPCRVCGALCNERRDVYDTAEAIPGLGPQLSLHDRFECPHRGSDWHREARALVRRIDTTAAADQRGPLYEKLERILRGRGMPAG